MGVDDRLSEDKTPPHLPDTVELNNRIYRRCCLRCVLPEGSEYNTIYRDTGINRKVKAGGWGQFEKVYSISKNGELKPYALKRAVPPESFEGHEQEWIEIATANYKEEYNNLNDLGSHGGLFPKVNMFGYELVSDPQGYSIEWPVLMEELIDGRDLLEPKLFRTEDVRGLKETKEALDPFTAAKLTLSILNAIREAHKKDVKHRDLTPRNILVRGDVDVIKKAISNGKDIPICIIDFGNGTKNWKEVIFANSDIIDMKTTPSPDGQTRLGTIAFCAPEIIEAYGDVDKKKSRHRHPKVDVYSVGAILFYLTRKAYLDNSCAFTEPSITEQRNAMLYEKRNNRPTPEKEGTAMGDLDRIVLKATAYEQEERIDIVRFISELQVYLAKFDVKGRYNTKKVLKIGTAHPSAKKSVPPDQYKVANAAEEHPPTHKATSEQPSPKSKQQGSSKIVFSSKAQKLWVKMGMSGIWLFALLLTNVLFGAFPPGIIGDIIFVLGVALAGYIIYNIFRSISIKRVSIILSLTLALLIPALNFAAIFTFPTVGFALPASLGFPYAQNSLANAYMQGRGVEANTAQALVWYEKAANQEYTDAIVNIALVYSMGEGVSTDQAAAVEWFEKAAALNSPDAQLALGNLYKIGQGVPQDESVATEWFKKAAEQGNMDAQAILAHQYYTGAGVEKDSTTSFEWAAKSAEQGNADAQNLLGLLYEAGDGVEKNYSLALGWFEKAADQGLAAAQNNLGDFYRNGDGVKQDYTIAVEWYSKAADQGYATAQANMGNMYYEGKGVDLNVVLAREWYQRAADQELATAQYSLGMLHYVGWGSESNYALAKEWFLRAANQKYTKSYYYLGTIYEQVENDIATAREWYQKAVDSNDNRSIYAKNALEIIDGITDIRAFPSMSNFNKDVVVWSSDSKN